MKKALWAALAVAILVCALPAAAQTFSTATFTIANGESLSAGVGVGGHKPIGVVMPSAWTAANLTFQVSVDGGTTWNNLYDKDGVEYTVTASTSRYIILPPYDWAGITHLKIRSGTAAVAVNQGAARTIYVRCRAY